MSHRPDYDSPWKDILERFFTEFTEFFFLMFILALTGTGITLFWIKSFSSLSGIRRWVDGLGEKFQSLCCCRDGPPEDAGDPS